MFQKINLKDMLSVEEATGWIANKKCQNKKLDFISLNTK